MIDGAVFSRSASPSTARGGSRVAIAARGGDPLLWQHLFWFFGHPEVYIIFLPAAGVVSMLVPVYARRPLVGYRWVVVSMIGTGFISFGLWVHHMFTVGIPQLAQAFALQPCYFRTMLPKMKQQLPVSLRKIPSFLYSLSICVNGS